VNLSTQGPQDDDGPAAMRLARRARRRVSAEADGSPEAMVRYRAHRERWRKYNTPEKRRRWRELRRARGEKEVKSRHCVDCHALVSRWGTKRCQSCAGKFRHQAAFRARALLELSHPFAGGRDQAHERNVAQLQQARLDLPL
jgi:hypothetical protein